MKLGLNTLMTGSLLCFFLCLSFSDAVAQDKPDRITLGIPVTALSQLPSYVGVRFGVFREEGLDVQIVLMNGRLVAPALLQGDLDYATLADTMMRAATTGLPVKVIAFGGIRPALALNVRPEIKTPADLKGKSIAVTSIGSTTDLVAREIIRSFGLTPERDIITQGLGSQANNQAALRAGAVHGAIFTPPYDVIGEEEGFRVLAWAGDVVKEQLQAGLVTSDNKISKNPAQVKRMVRGFVKSLVYLRKEKSKIVDFISKQWNIDADVAEKSYQVMIKTLSANGSASDAAIETVIQQILKANKSQKQVSHAQVANLTFLEEAQRELGVR
jgi:ABC-type nitrate/sulfonate/bicarbonate transport system substrate-binding protein